MRFNGGDIVIKYFKLVGVILITIFFCYNSVYAYEFIRHENESRVKSMINDIYDMKEQYEYFAGSYDVTDEGITMNYSTTSDSYWWPIGSTETTEKDGKIFATGDPSDIGISSGFGYREDPFGRGSSNHGGIDIPNSSGEYGVTNVIAAKSGVVVYPNTVDENNCPSNSELSDCGGSYGNYIKIQHNDGNYTLYAHLYAGSILVKAGDSVEQGQVIAKMGSSGASTGAHLHFEVREGSDSSTSRVDPLGYVDPSNPRPAAASVVTGDSAKQTVCLSLKNSGYNDDAVTAILVNMTSESGIVPYRLEGDFSSGYSNSLKYTNDVDSGAISRYDFINRGNCRKEGYGLVQWTACGRKEKLYDYIKSSNASIGDVNLQVEFFVKELSENYPGVNNYLKNVSYSAIDKTNYFCEKYEIPVSCSGRADGVSSMKSYVSNGCS